MFSRDIYSVIDKKINNQLRMESLIEIAQGVASTILSHMERLKWEYLQVNGRKYVPALVTFSSNENKDETYTNKFLAVEYNYFSAEKSRYVFFENKPYTKHRTGIPNTIPLAFSADTEDYLHLIEDLGEIVFMLTKKTDPFDEDNSTKQRENSNDLSKEISKTINRYLEDLEEEKLEIDLAFTRMSRFIEKV